MIAPADQHFEGHDYARNCCKRSSVEAEESWNCPYVQTWHVDAMIQINVFEIVIEKFQPSNIVEGNLAEDATRTYVQFSFDNAKLLMPKGVYKAADSKREKTNSENKKEKSKICAKDDYLGQELNQICDGKSDEFMCKILFMARNCEVPTLRKVKEELCYPCGVEIKIVAVHRSEIKKAEANVSSTSQRAVSYPSSTCNFLPDFQLQRKNAALKLVKRSLCWSQALHPGSFYVITETVPNEASSRILKVGNLEPLINVSTDMQLERVCLCQSCDIAALSKNTEHSAEIVQALDELKEDFLRNDKLCSVDNVLGGTTCQKVDFSETDSFQTRYGMDFSYIYEMVSAECYRALPLLACESYGVQYSLSRVATVRRKVENFA